MEQKIQDGQSQVTTGSIWASVGKLSAFVTLIIAIFTLHGQIYPDKANVEAKCQLIEIPKRPKSVSAPTDLWPNIRRSDESSMGSKKAEKPSPPNVQKNGKDIVIDKKTIDEIFPELLLELDPDAVLRCEVSNSGKQEAKDVVLDLPFEPKAVTFEDKAISNVQVPGRLANIGVIRPNTKTVLTVWGKSSTYKMQDKESYSISFTGGVGKVMFPTLAYGVVGKVTSYLNQFSRDPFSLFLALGPLLFFVAFLFYQAYGKTKKELNEPTTISAKKNTDEEMSSPPMAAPSRSSAQPDKGEWRD